MTTLANLSEEGKAGLILTTVCCAVGGISVALRFVCHAILKTRIKADDWVILATLVTYWAAAAVSLWGLFQGNGLPEYSELQQHPELLERTNNYLEAIFWAVTVIWLSGYLLKVSICLFYRRVLSSTVYRTSSLVLIAISTAWFIGTEVTNLVTCIPVRVRWHVELPHTCPVNFNTMYLVTGCIETVIDAAVFILPIRVVLRTQMSLKTRLTVCGIFLLGGFAVITDVIRMVYIYKPGSGDVNFEASQFWLSVHMAVSILSACLPTFKPLWAKIASFSKKVRDSFRSMFEPLYKAYRKSRMSRGSSSNPEISLDPKGRGSYRKTQDESAYPPVGLIPSLSTMHHTINISHVGKSETHSRMSKSLSEQESIFARRRD